MTELSNKLVKTMDNIFYDYINYNKNIEKKENPEMEIRFKPPKISKYDFENVINKLQNIGFKTDNPFEQPFSSLESKRSWKPKQIPKNNLPSFITSLITLSRPKFFICFIA